MQASNHTGEEPSADQRTSDGTMAMQPITGDASKWLHDSLEGDRAARTTTPGETSGETAGVNSEPSVSTDFSLRISPVAPAAAPGTPASSGDDTRTQQVPFKVRSLTLFVLVLLCVAGSSRNGQ